MPSERTMYLASFFEVSTDSSLLVPVSTEIFPLLSCLQYLYVINVKEKGASFNFQKGSYVIISAI